MASMNEPEERIEKIEKRNIKVEADINYWRKYIYKE